MPLWTSTTAPTFKPDAVLGDAGWEDAITSELLVSMNVTSGEAAAYDVLQNPPPTPVNATDLVNGTEYTITTAGDTDFTLVGALDSVVGTVFTASGAGTGTGTATPTA